MSPFCFNSFFILVQYIVLKLNVSSHPPVYGKNTKIFVRNTVPAAWWLGCCAHAHIGSWMLDCKGDRALSLPQCLQPWRAVPFTVPAASCLAVVRMRI
jgi:hypothetical protein